MRRLGSVDTLKLVQAGKLSMDDAQPPETEQEDNHPFYAQVEALQEIAKTITDAAASPQMADAIQRITDVLDQQGRMMEVILQFMEMNNPPKMQAIKSFNVKRDKEGRIIAIDAVRGE